MSPVHPLIRIDPESKETSDIPADRQNVYEEYFPNRDFHYALNDRATTNIYKAGDGRYYHVHGMLSLFMARARCVNNPYQPASIQLYPKTLWPSIESST